MQRRSIFQFRDYKGYLKNWIFCQPNRGYGLKSKLASVCQCNTTYVSQVLSGVAHFNLEQVDRISEYIGHNTNEANYFILLILHAKAGSSGLKARIENQIKSAIDEHYDLSHRLEFDKSLSLQNQSVYYSAWYYSAIHVVLSMKSLQSIKSLSEYFGLSTSTVSDVLEFLVSTGLAVEKNGIYEGGFARIHLAKDSPMIRQHHTNWRIKAIDSLEKRRPDDLHYSSVISISKKDHQRVKDTLVKAIEEIRQIVKESPEEAAYTYIVDFFDLEK